jgi:hypothetical protein
MFCFIGHSALCPYAIAKKTFGMIAYDPEKCFMQSWISKTNHTAAFSPLRFHPIKITKTYI